MTAAAALVDSVIAAYGRGQARRAQANGRHYAALRHWARLAGRNHLDAQYQIGRLYENGLGVVRDPIEAAAWYRKAAAGGYAPAQLQLGRILINGAQAALPQSLKQGAGRSDVALLFPGGVELEADPEQAVAMLRAAAESGEAEACVLLGALYFEGRRIARDYEAARLWYERGAAAGRASAQYGLGDIHFNGCGVAADAALGADWYEKAASQGHVRAQTALGFIYQTGRGRERDADAAGRWFVEAAQNGEPHALCAAARMLLSGQGLPVDADRAETYLRQAARQGHLPAMLALSELHEQGAHVGADLREAAKWRLAAAQAGHVESKFQAAQLLAAGVAGGVDLNEVARLYAAAAAEGHALAAFNLGALIAGSPANDRSEALPWYRQAAELGVREAAARLADLYLDERLPIHDPQRGLDWLAKAAPHDADAKERYALLLLKQPGGDLEPTEALLLEVAGPDRPQAAFALAELYAGRFGGRRQPEKAASWYALAARAGHVEARYVMAMALLERPEDPAKIAAGVAAMRALAEAGHAAAQFQLGVLKCKGLGVAIDLAEAIGWYRKSAAAGYAHAEYNLGVMLLKGMGTAPDPAQGRKLIALSVEKGIVPSRLSAT